MGGLPSIHAQWAVCVFALSFGLAASSSAAQATAPPAKAAPVSTRTTATTKQAATSREAPARPNLRKLAAEHKIITTEDLEKPQVSKSYHLKTTSESPSPDAARCDAECESEAREISGFGLDRLGEWDAQFIVAKHSLASSDEWRRAYFEALQKTRMYCTFQDQQEKAQPPTGNDYRSRYERARQEQYEDNMNRTLSMGVQNATAQISRLIDDAGEREPVRAAIMRVLAGRIFNQCVRLYDP